MYIYQDYLMHHGTKGMKWGIRKDKQNSRGNRRNKRNHGGNNNKKNNQANDEPNILNDSAGVIRAFSKYKQNKQAYEEHQSLLKETKQYTDKELRQLTNRLILENNYMNAKNNQNRVSNTKVSDMLDIVGSTVKLAGSAAVTAAAIISAIDKFKKG